MDFRFDLKLDTNELERNLQNEIKKRTTDIVNTSLNEQFRSPGWYGYTPGPQYIRIKDMTEAKFNTEKAQARIAEIIEERWEAALAQATEEAIVREAQKAATKALKKQKAIPQYIGK